MLVPCKQLKMGILFTKKKMNLLLICLSTNEIKNAKNLV